MRNSSSISQFLKRINPLSEALVKDSKKLYRRALIFVIFTFFISFLIIFIDRDKSNKDRYLAETEIIQKDLQLLSNPLESFDYDFARALSKEFAQRSIVAYIRIIDSFDYEIVNTFPEGVSQLTSIDVRQFPLQSFDRNGTETQIGRVEIALYETNISDFIWEVLWLSCLWTLIFSLPSAFISFQLLNRYFGRAMNELSIAISKSSEQETCVDVTYEPGSAFGEIAQKFNAMQESNRRYIKKTRQTLERKNKDISAWQSAAQKADSERTHLKKEAQILGDLLYSNSRILIYRTSDGSIASNIDRFYGFDEPFVSSFIENPCFSTSEIKDRFELDRFIISDYFIMKETNKADGSVSFVFQTREQSFWRLDLIQMSNDIDALIFSDQTALYSAQQKRNQEDRLATLGELTNGIAHDFNNHLNIISLATDAAREHLNTLPSHKAHDLLAHLDLVTSSTRSASGIVSHLLAFSHQDKPKPVDIDLHDFFHSAQNFLSAIVQSNIRIKLDIELNLVVSVLAEQLQTCVMNFATNARHAMPKGGTFTIRAYRQTKNHISLIRAPLQDSIIIEFQDTGAGMDQEAAQQIFEPFSASQTQHQRKGLGLYMVYEFAAKSNGSLVCSSSPGKGTIFTMTLPSVGGAIETNTAPTSLPAATSPALSEQAKPLEQMRIIVMDDDVSFAKLTSKILERSGANVHCINGVEEFKELLRVGAEDIHLILSDHTLRDGHPTDIAQLLKDNALPSPIIVMTGNKDEELEELIWSESIQAILEKPFKTHELLELVLKVSKQEHPHPLCEDSDTDFVS